MGVDAEVARSRGDVMSRLRALEKDMERMRSDRRLEAAAIGSGGLRVRGGHIIIQDAAGNETARWATDGLSLTGLLSVLGTIAVTGGGDISVTDGRLVASDQAGEVFAVDPTIPRIFMRPELIQQVTREVLAAGILSDSAAGEVDTSSSSYVALSGGPSISDVSIGPSGIAMVWLGAQAHATSSGGSPGFGQTGFMSVNVSGASSVSPLDANSFQVTHTDLGGDSFSGGRSMAVARISGLNEGTHTFAARYRVDGNTPFFWRAREIVVIGL